MLQNLKQSFYNPLCLYCGSFFVCDHLFCEKCYKIFFSDLTLIENKHVPFEHHFLINWSPGQSDLVSEMVYRLKSDRGARAWAHYASIITQSLADRLDLETFDALLPLPGSKSSSVHAWLLAKNIGQELALPVLNVLTKSPSTRAQKTKSASERAFIGSDSQLLLDEQFTREELSNLKLIYVDDILTTGQTFKRAAEAVGARSQSILVTMFYRPRAL